MDKITENTRKQLIVISKVYIIYCVENRMVGQIQSGLLHRNAFDHALTDSWLDNLYFR